jgi:osmoprotectant transport system substrate-binding protein
LKHSSVVSRAALATAALAALALSGCGSHKHPRTTGSVQSTPTTVTVDLPGTGRPPVKIGDKNFTEQFVLGELYRQALAAQGFNVTLNRNIGPTDVTIQALESGRLDLYPEYLQTWNTAVAGDTRTYASVHAAYRAGQRYARAHGLTLLDPTPFNSSGALAVTVAYAHVNRLSTIADLVRLAPTLTLGAPPQFKDGQPGLPALQQAYGVVPGAFTALQEGDQYQALDQGTIQAAAVDTTDGQLEVGEYRLLTDPKNVFGWGSVVPVVSGKVREAEGPVFTQTINRVTALLTVDVMRRLNADVDVAHEDPGSVAKRFLLDTGVISPPPAG